MIRESLRSLVRIGRARSPTRSIGGRNSEAERPDGPTA